MKHHRVNKTGSGEFRWAIPSLLLILVLLCSVFSAAATDDGTVKINVSPDMLDFSGTAVTEQGGYFAKTYDGTTGLGGTLAFKAGTVFGEIDPADAVTVVIESAQFVSKDCGEGSNNIKIDFSLQGDSQKTAKYRIESITLSAKVTPLQLEWTDGFTATASTSYNPDVTSYRFAAETISVSNSFKTAGKGYSSALLNEIAALTVTVVPDADNPHITADRAGTYKTSVKVSLSDANFTVSNPDLSVTLDKVVINQLDWYNATDFVYGERTPDEISVTAGSRLLGRAYPVTTVSFPEGFGSVGTYTLTAVLEDEVNFRFSDEIAANPTKSVTISPKIYTVKMKDRAVTTDGRTPETLTVEATEAMSADLIARIAYSVNGSSFAGATEPGVYEITATLPVGNYLFRNSDGEEIDHLTATLTVTTDHLPVDLLSAKNETVSRIILTSDQGIGKGVVATAKELTDPVLPVGTKFAQAFSFAVAGASKEETFTIQVPLSPTLYETGCAKLTPKAVYVYDADGKPVRATSKGYTVEIGDGYARISGLTGEETSFIIAPQHKDLFFKTVPGIVLIVSICVLAVGFFAIIGVALFRYGKPRRSRKIFR